MRRRYRSGMTAPIPGMPPFGPDDPEYGAARRATLAAYLREHERRFTREALRRAAEAAGYTPVEVAAAFDLAAPPSSPAGETFLVGIVYVLATALFVGLLSSAVVAGGAGVLGALALRNARPAAARGLACGVLVAIVAPAILLLGILGFCLVTGFRVL
jgi:hypothetical protein